MLPPLPSISALRGSFFFIKMSKVNFSKGALTYDQQLAQLQERGLEVGDFGKAKHLLEHLSYYRLSGYWHPFLTDTKKDHQFKAGSSLESAFKIYCFDKHLRKLIFSEIEKIEVAIRSKLIYEMSHAYGPFWLNDSSLFSRRDKYDRMIKDLGVTFTKSDEIFITSFRDAYLDDLPPSWIILELVSLGGLSMTFSNLNTSYEKRIIANHFGLNERVFGKWLHTLTYLRNICAHHTRLWNRTMGIGGVVLDSPRIQWLDDPGIRNDKTYYLMSILLFFNQTINPNNRMVVKFKALLIEFENIDVAAMGFPANWRDEPLWSKE